MIRKICIGLILTLSLFLVAGCSSKDGALKDIKKIFVKNSYSVKVKKANKNILEGEVYIIALNDTDDIQVFIYESEEEANTDAERIISDVNPFIEWIAPPHFYQYENAIILYVGEEHDIINILTLNFGDQIAGSK